jgi:hypothetical protein
MTTTLLHPGTTQTPTTDALRLLLDDVLSSVAAEDDADRYAGGLPAGRTVLSLAALARRAAGALGAEPGVLLSDAAGVVVQRELAAAARLLDEAAEAAHGESWELADLLVRAERLQVQLAAAAR